MLVYNNVPPRSSLPSPTIQVGGGDPGPVGQPHAGEAVVLEARSEHAAGGAAALGPAGQPLPVGPLAVRGGDHCVADTSRQGHRATQLQGRVPSIVYLS